MKIGVFRPMSHYILETVQDTAIVTMETNRNSYTIYRVVPCPMTLSDSNLDFKVMPIFDVEYLINGTR